MDSINKEKESQEKAKTKKEGWYDKISIRGYAQIRYNGLCLQMTKFHVISAISHVGNDFNRRRRKV
jgi:hypothetical protein